MEELKRLREVLRKEFDIWAEIDERYDRVEGSSEYIVALVVTQQKGTNNYWMLRMAPQSSFDRWANSAYLDLFFKDIDDLIGFLEQEKAYMYQVLFKGLSAEYDELRDDYGKVSADYEALYCEKRDRWIPVTEKLPKPDVKVLVSIKGRNESCVGWYSYEEDDETGELFGYWTTEYELAERSLEPVTHWMEKPEAIKEV